METTRQVIGGVDTHKDTHVVVALDHIGRQIDAASFASTGAGCRALLNWLRRLGEIDRAAAIPGTFSVHDPTPHPSLTQHHRRL